MNLKNTAALIGVGLVLGLGIGVPTSQVFQSVKTVAKPVPVKITNKLTTAQILASFSGRPIAVLSTSQQVTLPAGCGEFVGPPDQQTTYKWLIVVCPLSR